VKPAVADYKTRVICVRITPRYGAGTVIRITAHPRALVMGAQTYQADFGYEFTGLTSGTGTAAAVLDFEGILTATGIRRADVASGVYDNARIDLFATSWRTPVEDEEPLGFGFLGKTTVRDDRLAAEIMSAQDVLGQAVGKTFGPMCKLEFGGTEFGGCQKPLGPLTVTGTLTSVTDAGQFADSARAEAADYFTAGILSFTSGANAGLKAQEIRLHASGGAFTLHEPFYYTPAVGDAYTLIPGCRKRLADCVAWGNVARFGGFPHVPTSTTYTKVGTAS